jgi:hypothetical protein
LRCGRPLAEVESALPTRSEAWSWDGFWRQTQATYLLARGESASALALVEDQIANGDTGLLLSMLPKLVDQVPLGRLRALFERATRTLDDETSPQARSAFARICMIEGDVECVRFQAVRAAAQGARSAIEPLTWLSAHASSPREREDADRWLAALGQAPTP